MKKISFILFIFSIALITSCDSDSIDGCIQVKMIDQLCGTAIYQVTGGDVPNGVANSWTNNNGVTYKNVFTTTVSPCDSGVQIGDTFFVNIVNEPMESDCIQCLALLADAPEQFLHTVISAQCSPLEDDL